MTAAVIAMAVFRRLRAGNLVSLRPPVAYPLRGLFRIPACGEVVYSVLRSKSLAMTEDWTLLKRNRYVYFEITGESSLQERRVLAPEYRKKTEVVIAILAENLTSPDWGGSD